jgi:hypothetical protein
VTLKALAAGPNLILFKDDSPAFEFLGKLFLAHAKGVAGCGLQIGPGMRSS